MARRRQNMLEAFKVSRDQAIQAQREAAKEARRESDPGDAFSVRERLQRTWNRASGRSDGTVQVNPQGQPPQTAPRSAGTSPLPVVPGGPVQPSPPRALVDPNSPNRKGGMGLELSPWVLVGYSLTLALLSFVLGWQLGERSAAPAEAPVVTAGFTTPTPQGLPDPGQLPEQGTLGTQGGGSAEAQWSAADIAFEDPTNMYTLVIDQFNDNPTGRERVGVMYRYLQGQGFPVIQPRLRDDVIYLLVGAAPEDSDLSALLRELKALPVPGSKERTFQSAYSCRIDSFF